MIIRLYNMKDKKAIFTFILFLVLFIGVQVYGVCKFITNIKSPVNSFIFGAIIVVLILIVIGRFLNKANKD